jgi:alpha-L-fucosidase
VVPRFSRLRAPVRGQSYETKLTRSFAEVNRVTSAGDFRPNCLLWDAIACQSVIATRSSASFIHWGVYSVPAFANEWYSRNIYRQGDPAFQHHIETYGPQSKFGYKDFIPMFTASKFDPAAWVDLFHRAGAKYARSAELVDKYRPEVFYFDWWMGQPAFLPYRQRIAAYYYDRAAQWQKQVVLTCKDFDFPENAAVLDVERGKLDALRLLPWQSDTSVSIKSWGYVQNDTYRTAKSLIGELVDVVSKNGNLLLNIGSKSDGTIPDEARNVVARHWGVAEGKWRSNVWNSSLDRLR